MLYIFLHPNFKNNNTLVHIFIISKSARAKEKRDEQCSNLCRSSPLSFESVPSQSNINTLVSVWLAAHTPFVVCPLPTILDMTSKLVSKSLFNNVLFPVLCGPVIAMVL